MEKFKKIARYVGMMSAFVFVMGAGSAFAAIDVSGGNFTTGCESENSSDWNIGGDTSISMDHYFSAMNDYNQILQAGENDFGCNTCIDDISTGSIAGVFDISEDDCDCSIPLTLGNQGSVNVDLSNNTTGCNSYNNNNVDISRNVDVNINDISEINNSLNLVANTGRNRVECNTSVGDISTGDISLGASIDNSASSNHSPINLTGLGSGNISVDASNALTGGNSSNENNVNIDSNVNVSITNERSVENNIDVRANTGRNTVSDNTVVGDISTGDIMLDFSIAN